MFYIHIVSHNLVINLVENFFLGGSAIALTSYLGTFFNPLIGAIFWSYPITILPTVYFMKKNKKDNQYIAKFLLSTTFALGLLIAVTFFMSYFIKNTKQDTSMFIPMAKASAIWLILGLVFYFGIKYTNLQKYFM